MNKSMQLSNSLVERVQQNCDLSDAQYAGNYSMCTFLLKMREYYRWENKLTLSKNLSSADVGDWLIKREQHWLEIADKTFQPLPLSSELDPFDATSINDELTSMGYVYSSGHGIFGKPHFFIGKLSNTRNHDGVNIYISTQEFARDLVAPPAMSIDQSIFIRQESVRRFIWEKIEEWRANKNKSGPMQNVFDHWSNWHNFENIESILDRLVETETETMILHELGEIQVGRQLGGQWKNMVNDMSGTRAEFFLRAVRDILADCMITLPSLIEQEQDLSLHFFFANYSGLRKHLFPELRSTYDDWCESSKTGTMRTLLNGSIARWQDTALTALENYKTNGRRAIKGIEKQLEELIPAT